jgi:hypothetical protein
VPYVYDPGLDLDEPEEEDPLHDPNADATPNSFPFRGLLNVSVLLLLILALLCLFIIYPVVSYLHDRNQSDAITGNVLVNATGQVPFLCVYHSTISWSFSFLSSIYYPPG